MAIATKADLELSLLRALTDEESAYADRLLERAERLILVRIPDLARRADRDDQFALTVADVEAEMVARVLRATSTAGGGNFLSEQEGEYSYRLNTAVASGLLGVLDDEWSKLGVSGWGSAVPRTDDYLRARSCRGGVLDYGPPWEVCCRPDMQFQYGWPAYDEISPTITPTPGCALPEVNTVWPPA